jgi:hypothetical protein
MGRFHLPHIGGGRHEDPAPPTAEDPVVRQYRFLLRTAAADALERAHAEALTALTSEQRAAVLGAVQDALVAGQRLTADDTSQLAHLVTQGEFRTPGVLLRALPQDLLVALASAVVASEAAFGLFSGYAEWDGAEPEPDAEPWADHGFESDSGRWDPEGLRDPMGPGGSPPGGTYGGT